MGEHNVNTSINQKGRAQFIQHILKDIKALELMLAQGQIESGIQRIGAEQEFCLIDEFSRPSRKALDVLETANDEHFTTELATYNLEINLDPFELNSIAFQKLHQQLEALLSKAKEAATENDNRVLLCGILPTITKTELDLEYMTPNPRYYALNDRLKGLRGSDFHMNISGVDELGIKHDSVLFEACNTSFQMHLQIDPDDFIASYNWSQAIAGAVLGVCTNSPYLLGRELWNESRIALFQQSIDTRSTSFALKDQQARVSFGNEWETGTIADIYKKEIARFKIILTQKIEEDSLETLASGKAPKLKALNLHNGTIYRWNRACYGVGGGKAHLRIENRYIPSGPTVKDEIANMAFWVGLMVGRPKEFDDMPAVMDFKAAKANFIKAARYGKDCLLNWKGEKISLTTLVKKVLMPIAQNGLEKIGLSTSEIDEYLGTIMERCNNRNGAEWQIDNFRSLRKTLKKEQAAILMCEAMYAAQEKGNIVSQWSDIELDEMAAVEVTKRISHLMSSDLHTIRSNDLLSLAESIMQWKNIHHLPVEDMEGKLCGVISSKAIENYSGNEDKNSLVVSDVMNKNVLSIQYTATIFEAVSLMKRVNIGCLPVMDDEQIIGIITASDLIAFEASQAKLDSRSDQ